MGHNGIHHIITRIIKELFSAEERRLVKVREDLIQQNKECYPDKPHDGFTYSGQVYDPENLAKGKRTRVSLHFSLIDRMDEFLADQDQIWTDRHRISQMLFLLLSHCESVQDVRDVLPNCIVDTLEDLKTMKRVNNEAFTIQNDKRTLRQYEKLLPRMEFYATTRLLY